MKILKIIGWTIAIAGVVITFGNIKGWFIDKNRQEVYKQLLSKSSEYRVSVETSSVDAFIDKYYYSKKIPADMQSWLIRGLTLKWIKIGGKGNLPMAGSVHVLFENEQRSTSLISIGTNVLLPIFKNKDHCEHLSIRFIPTILST